MATQPCGCETAPRKIRPTKECIYHSALEDRLAAAEQRAEAAELRAVAANDMIKRQIQDVDRAAEALRVVGVIESLGDDWTIRRGSRYTIQVFWRPHNCWYERYGTTLAEALDNAVRAKETK